MAKFLIDAQLPPALAYELRLIGHDARHVYDIEMGATCDDEIAKEAENSSSILITKDEDFVFMSNIGKLKTPIIWIRIGNVTNKDLWRKFEPVLENILYKINGGERIVEVI